MDHPKALKLNSYNHHAHQGVIHVVKEIAHDIFYGGGDVDTAKSYLERTKMGLYRKGPDLKAALRGTSADLARWLNKGGPWRTFLLSIVGAILLLSLAGLSSFVLFFVIATTNVVAIGFLASVASVGAFVGAFFTALTAIYIGALVVAALAISAFTFFALCAFLTTAGWIGFLWILWQGFKKTVDFIRGSLIMTASALSTVSTAGSTKIIAVEKRQP